MAKRSLGVCELCGGQKAKGAMVAHLRQCLVAQSGADSPSSHLLLRAQPDGSREFWLDLAATPDAKLKDVDRMLRRVWLECCGHMSEFYTGAHRKVAMSTTIGEAFGSIGGRLRYVYDFGSSTELIVSLSGIVEGASRKPVRVVARNEPPIWPCSVCGDPATAICGQCSEEEGAGFCCSKHGSAHECGEEMLLPVVNSPRMGVCAYTGDG